MLEIDLRPRQARPCPLPDSDGKHAWGAWSTEYVPVMGNHGDGHYQLVRECAWCHIREEIG